MMMIMLSAPLLLPFRMLDMEPYLNSNSYLSYSAYNARGRHSKGDEPYDQPNELMIGASKSYLDIWHGGGYFRCTKAACSGLANGNWTHIAVSWTNHGSHTGASGAQLEVYINGEHVSVRADGAHCTCPSRVALLTVNMSSLMTATGGHAHSRAARAHWTFYGARWALHLRTRAG
jgi:hypothetical protein